MRATRRTATAALVVIGLGAWTVLAAPARAEDAPASLPDRAAERRELVERLDEDVERVDRALETTRRLIEQAAGRPYLPDLSIRLAELYVEKSRYLYVKAMESRPEGAARALDVPEVRLLKDQAVAIYQKLVRDYPSWEHVDKVFFFLAHEYRELGLEGPMLATYRQLVERYPDSLYAIEARLALGNHFFGKGDPGKAERHYRAILDRPESPLHEMARYKLAWIRVNQDRCPEALALLEQIARRGVEGGDEGAHDGDDRGTVGEKKLLTVRREALTDSVYCFSETRKPEEALPFYRELAGSRELFTTVAARLGARYEVKGEFAAAAMMLREAAERTHDPEPLVDRVQRLYGALARARTPASFAAVDRDVALLARAAEAVRGDWRLPPEERAQSLRSFEVYARDLATRAQVLARQAEDPVLAGAVAGAYDTYLAAFPGAPDELSMRSNRAEALFDAGRYVAAGEAYEALAGALPDGAEREAVLHSGIVAYRRALDGQGAERRALHHRDEVRAAEGLKQLGAAFVEGYPRSAHVPEVQFNVARQLYDEGVYDGAIERFRAFVQGYPQHRDATAAAHLALDAYFRKEDLEGLAAYGRELIAARVGDGTFQQEVRAIVEGAEARRIARVTIRTERTRDERADELVALADETEGAASLEALRTAFELHREAGNLPQMFAVGRKLVERDTEGRYAREIYPDLADQALLTGRFVQAAEAFEALQRVHPTETAGLRIAATIRAELGDHGGAARDDAALVDAGERSALPALLEALVKAGDWATLEGRGRALQATAPAWGALAVGRALVEQGRTDEGAQAWIAGSMAGDPAARGEIAWRLSELVRARFEAIRLVAGEGDAEALREKVTLLRQLLELAQAAVESGDATWAFAGLHQTAQANGAMAEFLRTAPAPDPEARVALDERAAQLQEAAAQGYAACREKGWELGVFNAFVMGCARESAPFVPDHRPAQRPLTATETQEEGALVGRLRTEGRTAEVVVALARLYLRAGDVPRARLHVLSALGEERRDPALLVALGAAAVRDGDPQDACAAWVEAGSDAAARLSLAALRWEFGDEAGARKALSGLGRAEVDPTRPDVHPAAAAALSALRGGEG